MSKSVAVAGLPAAGKTTFIAALYHLLDDPPEGCSIKLANLPNNSVYLHQIESQWSVMEPVDRTKADTINSVELQVQFNQSEEALTVSIPDISGEEFQRQWEFRDVSESYREIIQDCCGLLLFISESVRKPVMIAQVETLLLEVNDVHEDAQSPESTVPFDPKTCPHGVVLVDLLQIVSTLRSSPSLRLGVVISAWDRELKAQATLGKPRTPMQWLEQEIPILYQFLISNDNWLDWRAFGLSAQGGSYEEDRTSLQRCMSGADRVILQQDNQTSHDLSLLLKWVAEK